MEQPIRIAVLMLMLSFAGASAAVAAEPVVLLRNPFAPPLQFLDRPQGAGLAEKTEIEQLKPEVNLKLRATLASGSGSIANINGVMLTIGEAIEGFRLVEVGEGTAVLKRDKDTITLYLDQ